MLQALIWILVIAVVSGLFYWIIDQIPVPQPINRWAKLAIVVVAVIALVSVLLGAAGVNVWRLG